MIIARGKRIAAGKQRLAHHEPGVAAQACHGGLGLGVADPHASHGQHCPSQRNHGTRGWEQHDNTSNQTVVIGSLAVVYRQATHSDAGGSRRARVTKVSGVKL